MEHQPPICSLPPAPQPKVYLVWTDFNDEEDDIDQMVECVRSTVELAEAAIERAIAGAIASNAKDDPAYVPNIEAEVYGDGSKLWTLDEYQTWWWEAWPVDAPDEQEGAPGATEQRAPASETSKEAKGS